MPFEFESEPLPGCFKYADALRNNLLANAVPCYNSDLIIAHSLPSRPILCTALKHYQINFTATCICRDDVDVAVICPPLPPNCGPSGFPAPSKIARLSVGGAKFV